MKISYLIFLITLNLFYGLWNMSQAFWQFHLLFKDQYFHSESPRLCFESTLVLSTVNQGI